MTSGVSIIPEGHITVKDAGAGDWVSEGANHTGGHTSPVSVSSYFSVTIGVEGAGFDTEIDRVICIVEGCFWAILDAFLSAIVSEVATRADVKASVIDRVLKVVGGNITAVDASKEGNV